MGCWLLVRKNKKQKGGKKRVTDFGRVLTAMITPFNPDGSVNYEVAEKLAAHLADNGTDTVVVCGTTGESPVLTWEEEYNLFQVVQKAVAGKAKVMAGTGSNSTAEAIAASQKAAKLGLDGSLQVVPYYNKPPQAGLYEHFGAIAKSCPDLPIMLYNVPSRTSQNLQPETVARLAEIPNIVAIKEASGNFEQVSQVRRLTPPEFAIYSGDDSFTLAIMALGGAGVVSVASHLVGNNIQEMIQAFQSGKTTLAREIHLKFLPLFKVLFCTTNPIPVKAALKLQGWHVGSPRLPLCDIPPELEQQLKSTLLELSLI
ncbi:MAG TPA: 4-hydroxy-tetrahydrodipicolinate synthase [Cyanobacteria bacterium UBA11149]|nr:4-hydroxy-tetrahydrodipicolinate synthase [Cyanobacteria bacterium UBA11367]HBE60044.1 4-hydroxy-tetrahydrodipicolinate synthase [Cyanobacteria bacterium UBA11366]HBK62958.1 4-hydroxy-tetrahydrodipicolinate synthase [Cyanobacteria bacterium UBA11166]HBR75133.1 4-hydroxy-tetrahydrodipicolinate synthase [Cyanobacteria bacterium UBA11159]HBS68722.1 4-hydroxy-tetrahydrodipicolinate synthase [Cyanobacteria bacterium UBA11153]HBW91510.1 4-hydroxy-tetrahydrodipicolinate synthase [Cyanobacteria bac